MKIIWNGELYHYGQPRRSGRYKWGSGKNPYHHGMDAPKDTIKKYDSLDRKLEKTTDKTSAEKIISEMDELDRVLEKTYMDNINKKDLKRGEDFLNERDEVAEMVMKDIPNMSYKDALPIAEQSLAGKLSTDKYMSKRQLVQQLENPQFKSGDFDDINKRIMSKYDNPMNLTYKQAAKGASELMSKTNKLSETAQKAMEKGDLRKAVDLQKEAFAYAMAAQEYLTAEELLRQKEYK